MIFLHTTRSRIVVLRSSTLTQVFLATVAKRPAIIFAFLTRQETGDDLIRDSHSMTSKSITALCHYYSGYPREIDVDVL